MDNTVSQYTEDANGSLIPLASPTVSAGPSPVQVAVNPSGSFAYVTTGGGTVDQFTIGSDGALTALGTPVAVVGGGLGAGIAIDPSGHFVYVTEPLPLGTNIVAQFTIGPDGTLTAMSTPSISAATVATGGQPTQVTPDPTGRLIYVTNSSTNTVSQYSIGQDGTLTPLSTTTVATGSTPLSIATFSK